MKFNRKTFFDAYRKRFGSLDQSQVDGLEFLLDAFEKDGTWRDVRHTAYALATIKHEAANKWQPIKEYRNRLGSKGRANQDRYWPSGYYGRGYVQITWKKNYEKFGIASTPDKALEPDTAFWILTAGMHRGLFTGKKLTDFIKGATVDYHNARKIINGLDKAELIAGYARDFEKMLRASASTTSAAPTTQTSEKPEAETSGAEIEQGQLSDPASTAADPKPIETTVTRTEGDVVVEATKPNQQDVNQVAEVTSPEPQGVFKKLSAGIGTLIGGTVLWQGMERIGQISFTTTAIAVVCFVVLIAFLAFCFWAWLDAWKQNNKTRLEAEAKTAIDRKDIVWK